MQSSGVEIEREYGLSDTEFGLLIGTPDYTVHGVSGDHRFTIATGLPMFILLLMVMGLFMALGKAAMFKHVPVHHPDQVGAGGGAVGDRSRV